MTGPRSVYVDGRCSARSSCGPRPLVGDSIMAISANAVFGTFGGAYGTDARFGVRRSKRETVDGSTVDMRLRVAPASLSADDMGAAARHGVDTSISIPSTGAYAKSLTRAGIVAEYQIRGAMANDDAGLVAPAPGRP